MPRTENAVQVAGKNISAGCIPTDLPASRPSSFDFAYFHDETGRKDFLLEIL